MKDVVAKMALRQPFLRQEYLLDLEQTTDTQARKRRTTKSERERERERESLKL